MPEEIKTLTPREQIWHDCVSAICAIRLTLYLARRDYSQDDDDLNRWLGLAGQCLDELQAKLTNPCECCAGCPKCPACGHETKACPAKDH